jgi:hypothetical protein
VIGALQNASVPSRTELDSHANMVVLGKHCLCLTPQGKKMARVAAFSPTLEPMDIPIVDACIRWTDPLTDKNHFLLFEDALYVEQMEHKLIPPFLLRESGWLVNDVARIHTNHVNEFTHSLVLEHEHVHIPLSLKGVFSYFTTVAPTLRQFQLAEDAMCHHMTPRDYNWNPNVDTYARAEDSYLDWQGRLVPLLDREGVTRDRNLLDVSSSDGRIIPSEDSSDDPQSFEFYRNRGWAAAPNSDSDVTIDLMAAVVNLMPDLNLAESSAQDTPAALAASLEARSSLGQVSMNVGSTSVWNGSYLFDSSDDEYMGDVSSLRARKRRPVRKNAAAKTEDQYFSYCCTLIHIHVGEISL